MQLISPIRPAGAPNSLTLTHPHMAHTHPCKRSPANRWASVFAKSNRFEMSCCILFILARQQPLAESDNSKGQCTRKRTIINLETGICLGQMELKA